MGFRAQRRDTIVRRWSSKIANGVRNRLSGDDIIDTGCSLKAFRTEALHEIKLWNGMHRFLPTLVRFEGGTVVQVPVGHRPRVAGTSKYGVWNRLFRSSADLLAVRWMKSRRLGYEVVQWIASERKKASVVPLAFWWLSLGGGTALLLYAIHRKDPVFILGQAAGLLVYGRNLAFLRGTGRSEGA